MDDASPVFGMIYFGGSLSGALVRDMRLANELVSRGYRVVVWWAMDKPDDPPLDKRVEQHLLFNGFRYFGRFWPGLWESAGRVFHWYWPQRKRERSLQKRPDVLVRIMTRWMKLVAGGIEHDVTVIERLARQIREAGVTHLLPMLAVLGVYERAIRQRLGSAAPKQLITFQGYELYVNYARMAGGDAEARVLERMRDAAADSPWPAIAVSEDYADRVHDDIGVPRDRITAIAPGVPTGHTMDRHEAGEYLRCNLGDYQPNVPLITYLGRQDTEKGLDLLLYAMNILRRDGVPCHLAIVGPTLFGESYHSVMLQIARDLRLPLIWTRKVDEKMRAALFAASRCVVYPSIHREPFGMVPVEAAAFGTPSVVPDFGGIGQAITADGVACGLHFRAFDSGDLARQIRRLIEDDALWRQLSDNGPLVAEHHSVANLADRVLKHLDLPLRNNVQSAGESGR